MPKSTQVEFDSYEEAIAVLPEWLNAGQKVIIKTSRWRHSPEAIGDAVRKRREAANMSLRSMAKWMSVSPTYLSDMERGLRPWPLARLNDASNVLDMAERTSNN
jgi:predicted transcriptional regulator